jgi:hypothetical protein
VEPGVEVWETSGVPYVGDVLIAENESYGGLINRSSLDGPTAHGAVGR